MKNIAELNLLKSNLIIHKLAACVLLTCFLLRLLLKQRKNPCCYVFVSLLQLSRCTNALCSSTLSFPRCGASCGNGESRHPSGGNMHGISRSMELLHCCQLCFKFYRLPQNVKNFKHIYWSDGLPKGFLVDVFSSSDGGEKKQVHPNFNIAGFQNFF